MTTLKIVLRPNANKQGKHLIALRITKDRKNKFIGLNQYIKPNEWKNGKISSKHPEYLALNEFLSQQENKASSIIRTLLDDGVDFSLEQFTQEFYGLTTASLSVSEFWLKRIDELNREGRTGYAKTIKDSYNAFFRFEKNKGLTFKQLNYNLLNDFVIFLKQRNYSDSGIAVRLKDLRALYNQAIKRKIVDRKHYPFDEFKVSKFKTADSKRAIDKKQIQLIANLNLNKHPELHDAHNYFLFSYLSRGMNFIDIVHLKWSNISEGRLIYSRSKTNTRFNIKIEGQLAQIIEHYRAQQRPTQYVFPIISQDGLTPIQLQKEKDNALKVFNKKLKALAVLAGVSGKVTSYVIRHSYATNLKFRGTSTDIISQSMGHADMKTTQRYLKSFSNEDLDNANDNLLEEPERVYMAA